MLTFHRFLYCILYYWCLIFFLYNYAPTFLASRLFSWNKRLIIFREKPLFLSILWKNLRFFFYRKNALRLSLTVKDLFLLNDPMYNINWSIGFPAYVHLHFVKTHSIDRPVSCVFYSVAAWVYTHENLTRFIISGYYKALSQYHVPTISKIFIDYIYIRKK